MLHLNDSAVVLRFAGHLALVSEWVVSIAVVVDVGFGVLVAWAAVVGLLASAEYLDGNSDSCSH